MPTGVNMSENECPFHNTEHRVSMIIIDNDKCPYCGIAGKKSGAYFVCPQCKTKFSEFGVFGR